MTPCYNFSHRDRVSHRERDLEGHSFSGKHNNVPYIPQGAAHG